MIAAGQTINVMPDWLALLAVVLALGVAIVGLISVVVLVYRALSRRSARGDRSALTVDHPARDWHPAPLSRPGCGEEWRNP